MTMNTIQNIQRFSWVLKGLPNGPRAPFDRDLFAYPDVAVTPTVGAITAGWLLLIPRKATCCVANLADAARRHIIAVAGEVTGAMNVFPGKTVMFEHGARWSGSATGCGVDQAHIHLVNLKDRFVQAVLTQDAKVRWIEVHPSDPWKTLEQDREYYLITDFRRAFISYGVTGESQYLRRAVARSLSRPTEWDYRLFPNEPNARKTAKLISAGNRRKSAA
jgi:ATP adenylyltransferase